MPELSLHILDLVQNSIVAGASRIIIKVLYDIGRDLLTIEISDNGSGMDEELLNRVTSPFATTRTTRKVGLGVPMFKQCAEQCAGSFKLDSKPGKGTTLWAQFQSSHMDLPPMGDLIGTMISLLIAHPQTPEFELHYGYDENIFVFDTAEVRQALGGLPLNLPDVLDWVKGYLQESIDQVQNIVKNV